MYEHLDLACWRINYSLHLTPHELYDYWQAHGTPTGAVLALKAAVEEIERLRAAVALDSTDGAGPTLPPPCPNADERTNNALVAWARSYAAQERAAERERCCRVVVVQRDDRLWDVARRTILAIRAGDDYFGDIDDEGLLKP